MTRRSSPSFRSSRPRPRPAFPRPSRSQRRSAGRRGSHRVRQRLLPYVHNHPNAWVRLLPQEASRVISRFQWGTWFPDYHYRYLCFMRRLRVFGRIKHELHQHLGCGNVGNNQQTSDRRNRFRRRIAKQRRFIRRYRKQRTISAVDQGLDRRNGPMARRQQIR